MRAAIFPALPPGAPQATAGIACAGNWIVDHVCGISRWPEVGDLVRIHWTSCGVGGGAANVASDLCALGAPFPASGVGCIGDDEAGRLILNHCQRIGLATQGLHVLPGTPTGRTQVMALEGKNRTFFYHGGANDAFNTGQVNIAALAAGGHRVFYLGYLALLAALDRLLPDGSTGAARLLCAARATGMRTCIDLVSVEEARLARVVHPALAHTDYLVINEVEAQRISNTAVRYPDGTLDDVALERAAAVLITAGVRQAVVVHAPERALWFDARQRATWQAAAPVPQEDIVSSVGAGDAFCAGILYAIHEGWEPPTALRRAHLVAAACLKGRTTTDGIPPMQLICQQEELWVADPKAAAGGRSNTDVPHPQPHQRRQA